jgi:uncharacterized protein YcfJ
MVTQYDEKGKVFTQVVAKQPTQVKIQTANHIITGEVHVRPDIRLKDEMNILGETFIAVTGVVVADFQGVEQYRANFLLLNVHQIVWMIPTEELV